MTCTSVHNAYEDRVSISIHVYGASIGRFPGMYSTSPVRQGFRVGVLNATRAQPLGREPVMTIAPQLIIARQAEVTRLTLNRTEHGNALSSALVHAIMAAIEQAYLDGTALLVISGAAGIFAQDSDLSDLDVQSDDLLLARLIRIGLMLQKIHGAPFATLALAQGRVIGAGADLFAACEERWIVGNAALEFPVNFCLVLGTARLARLVGPTTARRWAGAGAVIEGDAALQSNLATARMEVGEAETALDQLVASMPRLDPLTRAAIRRTTLDRGEAGQAEDLASLVRSAARPGLKSRIHAYRNTIIEEAKRTGA